jgi:hypothetical protein
MGASLSLEKTPKSSHWKTRISECDALTRTLSEAGQLSFRQFRDGSDTEQVCISSMQYASKMLLTSIRYKQEYFSCKIDLQTLSLLENLKWFLSLSTHLTFIRFLLHCCLVHKLQCWVLLKPTFYQYSYVPLKVIDPTYILYSCWPVLLTE